MAKSRLKLWIALLGGLFFLQLGWWGYLLWVQDDQIRDAHLANLRLEVARAETALTTAREAAGGDAAAAWKRIAPAHPQVDLTPGAGLQPAGAALSAVQEDARRRRLMIIGEGSLFLVLTVLGLGLLLRVARRESYLALQQSNFLHAVTHEFRSPLQSLRLAVESLVRRPDPARAREYAGGMVEDIGRLEALVENVLAVGRLDAEAFHAVPRSLDLRAALEQEWQRFLGRAPGAAGRVQADLGGPLQAECDPTTLGPIFGNLLDNALKYGGDGPIRVTLGARGAYAVLAIRDSGRGFRPEDRRHLFERFWRAGDERVRTAPGAGLGLFLVAALSRAQGASVDAHSEGPGRGSEFVVRWPLAKVED